MADWKPIAFDELSELLQKGEKQLHGEVLNFWGIIKIVPVKWMEKDFGEEGNGFWVVAICDKRVIWYNDIEDGFNISNYNKWGEIQEYCCNQDELNFALMRLFELVKSGSELPGKGDAPETLS